MLLFHGLDEQTYGVHHHAGVGGLDGDDDVVEVMIHSNAKELHNGFDHALRRVAVFLHHARRERTVVHADADGRLMFAAYIQQVDKALFKFIMILGVVTWVDPHRFYHFCSGICYFGIEMYVSYEGYCGEYLGVDFFERLHFAQTLRRKT